ncbi:hypothetical protein [Azospirillum argentinense]
MNRVGRCATAIKSELTGEPGNGMFAPLPFPGTWRAGIRRQFRGSGRGSQ